MSKTATLLLRLQDGWKPVPDLCEEFGWKPHTLRAALSGLVLPEGGRIERRRENGVTSYRLAILEAAE